MIDKRLQNFALLLILLTLTYACSSSESTVIVVDDEPATTEIDEPDTTGEQFTQLNIGLIDSVTNFDPLFAENLSTQRVLTVIYDGLYTLDKEGNPIPALASSVEISEDSLEYLFNLDQNKFFHNSSIFNSGIGRRVNAMDVKNAFERSAQINVPDQGAQLLMGVRGFENYFLEKRSVYDPDQRVLEEVVGIQVIDSQTLGIVLNEKDPHFLTKLASPFLLIYPREAITGNRSVLTDRPVGTGTYQFNNIESDGTIVLIPRENLNEEQNQSINRINLKSFSGEAGLFQEFTRDQVDWIPEIGPETSEQILDENDLLQSSYDETTKLVQNNASRISAFYLNERVEVNQDWMINRLAYLTSEDISTRGEVTFNVEEFEITEDAEPLEQYYASYTEDRLTRRILSELHNIVFMPEASLVLFDIRVPTRQTSIYTHNSSSLLDMLNPIEQGYWLRVDTEIIGIHNNGVTGVEPTSVPWHLHMNTVRVENSESNAE